MIRDQLASHGVQVLWLDEDLLVVNKPCGMPSQSGRDGQDGLVELVAKHTPYAALHHRLDQPASGALALALSTRANPGLARAFRERLAQRTYHAVLGGPAQDTVWDRALNGKTARTDVTVLGIGSGFSAVRLTLHTGRQHQIRLHAAMAGLPVVGDRRHGGELGQAWPRLALHAARLVLDHPVTGKPLALTAPMPADLSMLWNVAGGS